ncbi:MAG: sulfatase-like hydrolase/transferase [Planctomycetaceae bacterium]|nr:sulfatase-like hydrolase/transferase [Planctomycetaceae bacterium]MCB9951003.1 sulfatase-like hydrolase/transferase [Planctomycetaceae bacterium]
MMRPNILWICTDQQRFDTVSSLGNLRINTPHVDQLVEQGVAFTQAYCQSPVCTPSRASFLTGRYPQTTRCRQNGQKMPDNERLLPRMLADAGYRCGLSGKLHLASCANGRVEERIDDGYEVFHWSHHPQPDWPENAYTQWLTSKGVTWEELYQGPEKDYVKHGIPTEYHQTTWCAEKAIEFINEAPADGRPWLFSVNMFAPHHPFDPSPEYLARYRPEDMPVPKWRDGELESKSNFQRLDHEWAHNSPGGMRVSDITPQQSQAITAAYYAMCEQIDDQVGRMLAALDASGQRENTIVIFMSDHGEMLGDHGLYLKGPHFYDEAIHVPLVMSLPGTFAGGLRRSAFVELTDLCPTLLECCGLRVEPQIQGESFRKLLVDPLAPDEHRADVYCEYTNSWTHHRSYGSMLRTRDFKLVVYHGTGEGELYDLREDPDEFENLWSNPATQAVKLQLMQRLFDRSFFTLDPMPPRLGPF